MSVAHSALLTFNAALNRPAYQSSLYSDERGNFSASLANDGSPETNATSQDNKPSCSHTLRNTNPWWAVDLGVPTTIYGVNFTNRGDNTSGMWLFCLEFRKVHILFSSVHSVT